MSSWGAESAVGTDAGGSPTPVVRNGVSAGTEDDQVSAIVTEFRVNRAVIEQAKGMLMFIYGVDADGAFALLRDESQRRNVKLRHVADAIASDLVALSRLPSPRPGLRGELTAARRCVSEVGMRLRPCPGA
ncbi:MAG: hypothetical protein QOJ95_5578 [Mycobacterium sp.]|nr:hypothetical protein [Mycobacterium sp.]